MFQSPDQPTPPSAPSPEGGNPSGASSEEEQVNPDDVKVMLVEVINRVKSIAARYNFDFNELLANSVEPVEAVVHDQESTETSFPPSTGMGM